MTTLFVATTGGHLAQLMELADRLEGLDAERLWVTFDTPQSRSLLADHDHIFITPIRERDLVGVLRGLGSFHGMLRRRRIDAVVSTGSAIALAFLPFAALRGIDAHYIESAARVAAPSLTGRLLAMVPGINLYRQYQHAAVGRWCYGGSVFDAFTVEDRPVCTRPFEIVVTLGSVRQSFRRLLDALVGLLPPDASILWQTGHTPTDGLTIDARPFVPGRHLADAMAKADIVIAHGGCGSALQALKSGRLPILIPRDAARGEIVDGHQIEIARWLGERGLALHRSPETLTLEDIRHAAAHRVTRANRPPPFILQTAACITSQ